MPSDGAGPQKISPDESEDLPGLSAGSSESEDLPDPTAATYPAASEAVKHAPCRNPQIAHFLAVSALWERPFAPVV